MRALILPALLLVMLPALAASPLTFEEVDTDGDGLISADEAANVEDLDFNAADSDNDGTLSVDEYDIAMENLSPPAEATASTSAAAKPEGSTTPASPAINTAKPAALASPSTQAHAAKPTESATPDKSAPSPATPKP